MVMFNANYWIFIFVAAVEVWKLFKQEKKKSKQLHLENTGWQEVALSCHWLQWRCDDSWQGEPTATTYLKLDMSCSDI